MRNFILLYALFFFSFTNAQTILQTYDNLGLVQGEKILATSDGYTIYSRDTTNQALVEIDTDPDGNFLSNKVYFEGSANMTFADGFFYETESIGEEPNRDVLVRKRDNNGIILIETPIYQALDNYGVKIVATADGGMAVAGVTQVAGDSLYRIQIIKLNADGQVLWKNTISKSITYHDEGLGYIYGDSYSGGNFIFKAPQIKSFQTIQDGFLINNSKGYDSGHSNSYQDNFIRLDAYGKVLWNRVNFTAQGKIGRTIPSTNYGPYVTNDIDIAADGTMIVGYTTRFGTAGYVYAHIQKWDADANILWTKTRIGYNGTSSQTHAVAARADGTAWWVVDDKYDSGGEAGPAPFYNTGLAIYQLAESPSPDTTYDGNFIANIVQTKLYQQAQGTVIPINGNASLFSNPYQISDIIVDGDEGFVTTGQYRNFDFNIYSVDNVTNPFLLKENLAGQCLNTSEELYYYGTYDEHQYFISKNAATRTEAQAIAEGNGGYLLTLNSQQEQNYISNKIYGGAIWLGLTDAQTEGIPLWDNGEALTYTNWDSCGFNNVCIANDDQYDYTIIDFSNDAWAYTEAQEMHYIVEIDCGNTYTPKADLAIDSLGATPSLLQREETFPIYFKLYNLGVMSAENYSIKVYFSTDYTLDEDDFLLETFVQNTTPQGMENHIEENIIVPNDIPFGDYRLIIVVDADDAIAEMDETNNAIYLHQSRSIRVAGLGADLQLTDLQNLAYTLTQGEVEEFTFDLNNLGNTIAQGDYTIEFYLSPVRFQQDVESPMDLAEAILVGTIPTGNTPVGTIEDVPAAILIPNTLPYGRYDLLAFIDVEDDISELEESNNNGFYSAINSNYTTINAVYVEGAFGPDLVADFTTNFESIYDQGQDLTFEFVLTNTGEADAVAYYSDIMVHYAWTSSPTESSDEVERDTFPPIAAGESISIQKTLRVPFTIDETNYLKIIVDNNDYVEESNEENNILYSTPLQVNEVEIPDLSMSNLLNVPDSMARGEVVSFQFDLNNEGTAIASGDYLIGMYLSQNNYFYNGIPSDAILAGEITTGNTPIGSIEAVGGAITVPADIVPGDYFLVLYADVHNTIDEIYEQYNYLASHRIRIPSDIDIDLTCPADITVQPSLENPNTQVFWEEEEIIFSSNCNDNLDDVLLGQTLGLCSGSYFPEGLSTVEYSVEGSCLNAATVATCTFDVTVLPPNPVLATTIQVELCEGEIYNDLAYQENTILVDTLYLENLDSIITTEIFVYPKFESTKTVNICLGDTYTFGNENYNESGFYTQNLTTQQGCDSVLNLDLKVIEVDTIYFFDTTCDSTTAGIDTLFLQNQSGCDSIIITETIALPTDQTWIQENLCEGASILINDILFDETNTTGAFVLNNSFGCDSIVNVEINIMPTYNFLDSILLQEGDLWNDIPIFNDTLVQQNLMSVDACDSLVTTHIIVESIGTATAGTPAVLPEILVYPNPTLSDFTIEVPALDVKIESILVYNSIGQLVHQKQVRQPNPSVKNVPKGVHWLVINTNKGRVLKQVIVL